MLLVYWKRQKWNQREDIQWMLKVGNMLYSEVLCMHYPSTSQQNPTGGNQASIEKRQYITLIGALRPNATCITFIRVRIPSIRLSTTEEEG